MTDAATVLKTDRADCIDCGRPHALAADSQGCTCPTLGNLAVRYRLDGEMARALRESIAAGEPSLWRYAPLLPVCPRFSSHLAVGWTPLLDCGAVGGQRLLLKDETRNPSGSLKDRATEIVVAVAAAAGVRRVIVASTGNAAASLACIGAAAGLDVTVLVPDSVPPAKLAQILAYGARVHRVAGRYDDAYLMAARIAEAEGIVNRSTGRNPFTREGKKTCAFEIAEQLGWQAPEWVIVPTGDGNILSAIWKGFRELVALGLLDSAPRLVAAQAEQSSVIAARHEGRASGGGDGATIADSINVGEPRDATAALAALAGSRGLAVTVDDVRIVAAVSALASRFGVFAEPSSAAAFAAFETLQAERRFEPGDRVVCLVTGTGLKDLRPVLGAAESGSEPAVDPADWRRLVAMPVAAAPAIPR